jgi:hypothetical protein
VAALVFGGPAPLEQLLVGGETIVQRDELLTADDAKLADGLRFARRALLEGVSR